MVKVQAKKKASGKKPVASAKARQKSAKPAPKRPAKKAAAKPAKKVAKSKPVKKIAKKPAPKPKAKVTAKGASPSKATKPTAKPAAPAPRPVAPVAKASKAKAAVKTVAKVAASAVAAAATAVVKRVAAPADEKKRARRARPKVQSSGVPTATWFSQGERPRPSSFIPAPPRAEAPSLVAAPPASSDRLVSHDELTEFTTRTVPVRVDVEAGGGKVFLSIYPMDVTLKPGEGIEWDFRYIGGADVTIDELIVEFDKPSPFSHASFKSRRPGSNRPHRQLSGAVNKNAVGKTIRYTIRAFNAFKMEMATAQPGVAVTA